MAKKTVTTSAPASAPNRPPYMLIEQIQVKGYKSLVDATLHVRPLTLLAGTNSSGKSSIMQPLLLIKQTMEAPYQPAGALVLSGAHVQAETAGELVSKITSQNSPVFVKTIGINILPYDSQPVAFELAYQVDKGNFKLIQQETSSGANLEDKALLKPDSVWGDVYRDLIKAAPHREKVFSSLEGTVVEGANGFLSVLINNKEGQVVGVLSDSQPLRACLSQIMHIPGLRGAPSRSYPATFFQGQIKGTFDLYAAGTINQWRIQKETSLLATLNKNLRRLDLTDVIVAKEKNANEIELKVSRLPAGLREKPKTFEKKSDMVNIADVGIGVSQVLPILVALIAAQEGQIVYVEQPELHLHPRAQVVMAELLAEAANRGVRVIVETHSSLLLLTVQTLIAENKIKNTDVGLHWFARDAKGATQVEYKQPDEDGSYGEWPEDFGDVEMKAQREYLDAATRRQPKRTSDSTAV
ncbi:AAA family ATPase [Hymenobacter saemangeumensis]